MAYAKRYESEYKSSSGDTYTLEIFCNAWPSASVDIKLSSGGCAIKYETNGEKKFSNILASSMDIPFIVEDTGMQNFIDDLRDGTYAEKDVYVYLYNSNDLTRPVWAGYVLMDLSAKQDISFPYEVKLTAVDGLGLLKDKPFVREIRTSGGSVEFPYEKEDVWYNEYTTFRYWIEKILVKTGSPISGNGLPINYTYQTSVNWYNSLHTGTSQTDDPLALTQCKMNSMYVKEEDGFYTPKSTYDVLESICKSWGMRCVYWNHTFHFIQIAEYLTANTGTVSAPINIPTREYYYNGGLRTTRAFIGSKELSRYQLELENITDPNYGLQKLAGSQYDYYPPIKKVIGNFNVFADGNHFSGFPALDQTTSTTNPIIYSSPIATLKNANNSTGWFCQIPLNFSNITSQKLIAGVQVGSSNPRVVDMQTVFSIRAKVNGAASWNKMLVDIGGVLSWTTYDATVSTNYITNLETNIPIGSSQRIIFDSTSYAGGLIPTDAAFTGDWDFEFFTFTNGISSVRTYFHGTIDASSNSQHLTRAGGASTTFNYSNPYNSSNQYKGIFAETTGGVIGGTSIRNEITTSTSDSYIIELNDLYWGDSDLTDIGSTLKVWNGSSFVNTSDSGNWGVGTLTGTESFVNLLAKEVMSCQSSSSLKMNATSALSETNKDLAGGYPKFVNPVGRILDLDNRKYVMLRGTFTTGNDEWSGEWFQSTYTAGTVTLNSSYQGGIISGPIMGGANQGGLIGNGAQSNVQPWGSTATSARLPAGITTSIPIDQLESDIFKTGDVIYLIDDSSGQRISFVINADQVAADTSLTVVSKGIEYDLRIGSLVGIDNENLIQQYQRKTEGQVAGFNIDEDGITKGGVEITGWLDSDTMTGATANNVPTAESVKAYVDASSGGGSNYSMARCTTTTTTSSTDGEFNAVVIPFDTELNSSVGNTIVLNGSAGVSGVSDTAYSFHLDGASGTGQFELNWSVGIDTNIVNNRILCGVQLQTGTISGATITWSILSPSNSYIYNRGAGAIRKGSSSNSIFVTIGATGKITYFRLMFWKEASSNGSMNAISIINSTQITMKKL